MRVKILWWSGKGEKKGWAVWCLCGGEVAQREEKGMIDGYWVVT